jgi:plastocyanin
MKTIYLLTILLLSTCVTAFCTTVTITNSGEAFTPSTVTIIFGDTVNFVLESIHDAREVSEATWSANGTTALPGFQTAFGGGTVLPSQLAVGTHYYVCTVHVAAGMKGIITVQNPSGISDIKLHRNISVFPNPSNNLITIKSGFNPHGSTYQLLDRTGRLILTESLKNGLTTIAIDQLANGIYFLKMEEQTFNVIKN